MSTKERETKFGKNDQGIKNAFGRIFVTFLPFVGRSSPLGADNKSVVNHPEWIDQKWKELIIERVEMVIENYELLEIVHFSPILLTEGEDTRDWEELTQPEKEFIKGQIFAQVGFDERKSYMVSQYEVEAPTTDDPTKEITWEGKARVNVYKTARSDENMYLHLMDAPGLGEQYFIAPKDFRL